MTGNGITCRDDLGIKTQIVYLIRNYIATHKVVVEHPAGSNGQVRHRVYVYLNEEDRDLDEHEYNGRFAFWGSYIGQFSLDGRQVACYLFKREVQGEHQS